MPNLPVLLADRLEPWFGRPAHVTAVEALAPRLRRVRFEGAALRHVGYVPGQEVEFRASGTAFRHYTPAHFDAERGSFSVYFYLHGRGPGSAWAAGLQEGAQVNVLGPGGGFVAEPGARTQLFLGDETCVGLFVAIVAALPSSCRVVGAIEVDEGSEGWPEQVGLPLEAVVRDRRGRGRALEAWVDGRAPRAGDATAYVAGHAGSVAALRKQLVEQRGFRRRDVLTKPYWADGKRGL